MNAPTAATVRPSIPKEPMSSPSPIDPRTVGARIMDRLGKVPGFTQVKVAQICERNFRVNVWATRPSNGIIPDNHIPYSYFVWVDENGDFKRVEPPLPTEPLKGE